MKSSVAIDADITAMAEEVITVESLSGILSEINDSAVNKLESEVVYDVVDTLPETATIGQAFILTTDNKVYTFLTTTTTDGGVTYPLGKVFSVSNQQNRLFIYKVAGDANAWVDVISSDLMLEDITYADLQTLISENGLVPGKLYRFEYQTMHYIKGVFVVNTGILEHFVVEAISNNQLKLTVDSEEFPKDVIYFDSTNNQDSYPITALVINFGTSDYDTEIVIGGDHPFTWDFAGTGDGVDAFQTFIIANYNDYFTITRAPAYPGIAGNTLLTLTCKSPTQNLTIISFRNVISAVITNFPINRTGWITRRIATDLNIEAPFDIRNYKYRTYKGTAPAWVSGSNYAVNAMVTYNDTFYYCIEAVTAGTTTPDADTEHFQSWYTNVAETYWFFNNSTTFIIGGESITFTGLVIDLTSYQDQLAINLTLNNVNIEGFDQQNNVIVNSGNNVRVDTAYSNLILQGFNNINVTKPCPDLSILWSSSTSESLSV